MDKITRRDHKLTGSDHTKPSPPNSVPTIPTTAPQAQDHLATPATMGKRRQAAQGARNTARYDNGLVRKQLTQLQNPLSRLT